MALHGRQIELVVVPVVFCVLAIIFVALRLRARAITAEPYKGNDYFIVVATVMTVGGSIAFAISSSTACLGGDGCLPAQIALYEKTYFAFQFFYMTSISCIKISILLFYKRLFQSRRFTQVVYLVVAVVAGWGIAFVFIHLFAIWPIASRWDFEVPMSWEINGTAYWISNSSTDVLTDLITLCLPLPMIRRLHMSGRNKLALTGAFALGCFASVAGIMRMIFALKMVRAQDDFTAQEDAAVNMVLWSTLEPCVGIVCACLPLLHPYFKRHSPEAIVGANSAGYGVLSSGHSARGDRASSVYKDPRGLSMYMSHVSDYHENVIE